MNPRALLLALNLHAELIVVDGDPEDGVSVREKMDRHGLKQYGKDICRPLGERNFVLLGVLHARAEGVEESVDKPFGDGEHLIAGVRQLQGWRLLVSFLLLLKRWRLSDCE